MMKMKYEVLNGQTSMVHGMQFISMKYMHRKMVLIMPSVGLGAMTMAREQVISHLMRSI